MRAATGRGLRRGGLLALVTTVIVVWSAASPAAADDGGHAVLADGGSGGLLGPWNVRTPDGMRVDDYQLYGGGDSPTDSGMRLLLNGLFALARTLVGGTCWLVDWAYKYPIVDKLVEPAQQVSDTYQQHIVEPLGITGLWLAWAFVFGLLLAMRGKVARGAGEIVLTLLICALAASSLVRPDYLLGYHGPIQQVQRASLEAASVTSQAGRESDGGKKDDPCDLVTGPAKDTCTEASEPTAQEKKEAEERKREQRREDCDGVVGPARDVCISGKRPLAAADVSKPITRTLTEVLVVQPYQLLQWGQIIKRGDPMHKDYVKAIDYEKYLDSKANKDSDCDLVEGPAKKYCEGRDLIESGETQRNLMKEHGDAGEAAASYNSKVSWSRVLGALFLLVAAALFCLIIMAMVLAMLCAQFAAVAAAAMAVLLFAWAILPGPNRSAVWKWVGTFMAVSVMLFAVSVFIPFLGVAARAVLTSDDTVVVERLILLDVLALAGLAGHRRMLVAISNMGQTFSARMRYAKVGGSHLLGDNAAGIGMALASLGVGGQAGGGMAGMGGIPILGGPGGSPALAAFHARRGKISAAMTALTDPTGIPGHPGRLLADARAEGRRALAPLSLAARGAQHAFIGKPPTAGQLPPGMAGGGTVIDGKTGRVISQRGPRDGEEDEGFVPAGQRLRQRIARTRGGRVALGAGRVAWHSTIGLPAMIHRLPAKRSEYGERLDKHLAHYEQKLSAWGEDSRAGMQTASASLRRSYEGIARPLRNAEGMQRWTESEAARRDAGRTGRPWTRFEDDTYAPPPRPGDSGGPARPAPWSDVMNRDAWPLDSDGAWRGPRASARPQHSTPKWKPRIAGTTQQVEGGIIINNHTGEVLSDPYRQAEEPPPPDDAPPPPRDGWSPW